MTYENFIKSVNEESARQAEQFNQSPTKGFKAVPLVFSGSTEMRTCFVNGLSAAHTLDHLLEISRPVVYQPLQKGDIIHHTNVIFNEKSKPEKVAISVIGMEFDTKIFNQIFRVVSL